jgi:cytochrome P450
MPVLAPRYDALDPAVLDNPYPIYARLRQAGRVCRGGPGQLVVTQYADVAALLHDPRLGHQFPDVYYSFSLGDGEAHSFFRRILLDRDPPDHTRLRQLMSEAFSPALMRTLAERVRVLVDERLHACAERGRFDAVSDLAFPLPYLVICDLLGVPADGREDVRPWVTSLCRAFNTHTPTEERPAIDRAIVWLRHYLGRLVDERRTRPCDDLISRMAAATHGPGALSRDEIVDNAIFLFFAGFETTSNLIAAGCAALLEHPGELQRLRADASLVATAVEEFLRYDAPIQSVARLVLEPIDIGSRTIRRNRVLVLLLGSANHDERQFDDPERLNVGRKPNPHLAFGGGIHYCLGATLGRLEAVTLFERLLKEFAVLEPAGPVVRRASGGLRSYASVPVVATSA